MNRLFSTICFISKGNITFISLCLSLKPLSFSPWAYGGCGPAADGLVWLPWGWPALQRCTLFTKGKSQPCSPYHDLTVGEVPEKNLSGLYDHGTQEWCVCMGYAVTHNLRRTSAWHDLLQNRDSLRSNTEINVLLALIWDPISTSISLFSMPQIFHPLWLHLKSQPPKPGKSWKGHRCTTNCRVELGNSVKLPSVTSHCCSNPKTFTRCSKHPNCGVGRRHSHSSGPSIQTRHQEGH